jgi:hypothetical protein
MLHRLSQVQSIFLLALGSTVAIACSTPALSPQGAHVAVARNPPPNGCDPVGYLVGEGGGTFGEMISNDQLVEYAMNDLRNKAAAKGANYVQSDPPHFGQGKGTTTTATMTGTAYRCSTQ